MEAFDKLFIFVIVVTVIGLCTIAAITAASMDRLPTANSGIVVNKISENQTIVLASGEIWYCPPEIYVKIALNQTYSLMGTYDYYTRFCNASSANLVNLDNP